MQRTADVVVIGGGVIGTSIAYHLAQRGIRKVALLEQRALAGGATGKSTANVRQHYGHETLCRWALEGLRTFERFGEVVGGDAGFVRSGFLLVVGQGDRAAMAANVAMQRRLGIRTDLLGADDLRRLEPRLVGDDVGVAAYEPDAGYADPVATTASFATRARDLGASVEEGATVRGIRAEAGRIAGVVTDREEIATRAVVLAAGGWSPRLAAPLGVELPITNTRWQLGYFRAPVDFGPDHPVIGDLVQMVYFRPTAGGATIVGELDPVFSTPIDDLDDYAEGVESASLSRYRTTLRRRLPDFGRAVNRGGYSGFYDVTPDWQPILDCAPGVEGLYLAAGFSGHGFKLAPAVGRRVAALVTGDRAATEDLRIFRFSRFAEGELIRSEYDYGSKQL